MRRARFITESAGLATVEYIVGAAVILGTLVDDDEVTDILVNDPASVYVERGGRLERTEVRFRDAQELADLVYRIAASVGRELTIDRPFVDARMRGGSRANAVVAPVGG